MNRLSGLATHLHGAPGRQVHFRGAGRSALPGGSARAVATTGAWRLPLPHSLSVVERPLVNQKQRTLNRLNQHCAGTGSPVATPQSTMCGDSASGQHCWSGNPDTPGANVARPARAHARTQRCTLSLGTMVGRSAAPNAGQHLLASRTDDRARGEVGPWLLQQEGERVGPVALVVGRRRRRSAAALAEEPLQPPGKRARPLAQRVAQPGRQGRPPRLLLARPPRCACSGCCLLPALRFSRRS